ncbi:MAG TPA: ATP-binding protein [Candidatus Angelobacter sp.]|nr:ATP-binding protein [Candidatus Angelobacter sp.]
MDVSQSGREMNQIENKGFDHVPYVYITLDQDLTIQSTNLRGTLELEGDEDQLIGRPFLSLVVPSDRTLVQDYVEVMNTQNRNESEWECRLYSKDGKSNWYQVYMNKEARPDGENRYELFFTNCSKLKMYEQFLAGEKEVLEAIAKNLPLKTTLKLLAEVVESVSEQGFCSILLVDQDGKTLLHGGGPSLPKAFNDYVNGRQAGPAAGSCGTAVFRKKAIMVSDIETHPFWEKSRAVALSFGLKACWSTPIINPKGRVIGTFAMYYKKKHTPTADEVRVIRFFTHLAELAITHNEIRKHEIQVSEEKYRMIAENTLDLITLLDGEGRIEFASPSFSEVIGIPPEYYVGKSLFEVNTPMKARGRGVFAEVIKAKTPQKFQFEVIKPTGEEIVFEATSAPILNQDGAIEKTVFVSRDITERRAREERQKKKEEQFRDQQKALQELHVLINDLPLNDAIKVVTERAVNVMNVERASVWLLTGGNDFMYCKDLYEKSQKAHSEGRRLTKEDFSPLNEILTEDRVFIFRRGDERIEKIYGTLSLPESISSILMAPLFSGKQVVGIVSFALKDEAGEWENDEQNIASAIADLINLLLEKEERLKAEELLRKTEKLSIVGQLAAGVAHEIRNPLTSLKGFLQLLKERNEVPENSPFYDIMLSEIDRIHFISGELLFLAKPQAKKFGTFDLVTCLDQVIHLFETETNLHNIQLQLANQVPENLLAKINGDQNQIKQVLVNIIKNGMEAMPSGGTITIEIDLECEEKVRIKVKDQGRGIAKERLEKLGEPFYTTKEKGTGLGLMVSSRIVETHRGTIQFDSKMGEGTAVTLIFPKV